MIRKPLNLYRELKAQVRFIKKRNELGAGLRRFRHCRDKKPTLTILRELIRTTYRYRCIPDQYFRYNLYRRDISSEQALEYVSRYTVDMKWFPIINNHFKNHPLLLNNKIFSKQFLMQHGLPVSEPYVYILNHTFFTPEMKKISVSETLARLEASGAPKLFCKSDILDRATGITCFSATNGAPPYYSGDTVLDHSYLEHLSASGGFLIERGIEQHPMLAQLHQSSLNTFRIVTQYHPEEASTVLWAILRIGCGGNPFDNICTGGLFVVIDPHTGTVTSEAFNNEFETISRHPDTGVSFENLKFPFISEVTDLACRAADVFPTLPSIGWDIAYTENGPVIIEGNDRWGSDPYQMVIGGIMPLIQKEWFSGEKIPL